ncbi:MAG TPA: hypothetical protein VFI79_18135 [Gemmatimonadales bacterium]|nr:hypothetical protein [Gemmatimonadales bacterium]
MAADDNAPKKVFFKTIKEVRGNYLAEYSPPRDETPYGALTLSCVDPATDPEVAHAMESELAVWALRYRFPLLVSAFDPAGDFMKLESIRPSPFLVGWPNPDGTVESHWRWFEDGEIPKPPLDSAHLLQVYKGVPYTTPAKIEVEIKQQALGFKILKWILVLVYVIVPAVILILGVTNPIVGWTTFGVSLLLLIMKMLVNRAGIPGGSIP